MNSIVLIGMPGCGKTTIGKLLAEKLDFEFIDMDAFIEESCQKTVKELFSVSEEYFRDRETEACQKLSEYNRTVIASGGGVVKHEKNILYLKKNCTVVFVDRSIDDILSDIDYSSRPLLEKNHRENLVRLFNERYELYRKYGDFSVLNNRSLDEVVDEIIDNLSGYIL